MNSKKLTDILTASVRKTIGKEEEVAVAYSGGVDSCMVDAVARKMADVTCYTCTTKGAHDGRNAMAYANLDGRSIWLITLTEKEIPGYVAEAAAVLGTTNPVQVAYTVPVLAVLDKSVEKVVLVGSGADELFAGYAKYEQTADPSDMMRADLEKMLAESGRLQAAAKARGKRMGFPFASKSMIAFAAKVPLEEKIGPEGRKLVLRKAAKEMFLAGHARPKKASQYSSGVMKEMDRLARRDRLPVGRWVERIAAERRASP